MKKPVKLPFGLNENKRIVHIADVEKGKKCNCVCPDCGSSLIARKGNDRQHHFKHAVVSECEGEGAIHRAGKQIIAEKKQITLSKYIIRVSKKDSKGREYTAEKTVVENGTNIRFDSAQEEVELHGMRADVLAKKGHNQLIIEVFYRHKVDDQKCEKIVEANISAVEIDISDLSHEDIKDWETFWLYINDPQRVRWLHNAKAHHTDRPELERQVAEKIQKQEEQYKQEEIEAQERAKKELAASLDDLMRQQRKEYRAPDNRPLLYRPSLPQRRGPPPIDLVHPGARGAQRSGSHHRNQSFGRRK